MAVTRLFDKIGLSLDINVSRNEAFFTWSGRLFHAVGPAIERGQLPNFIEDHGTCSRFFDEGRSRLSATSMQKSER